MGVMPEQVDIHEFPDQYDGRKTYVRVAGYSKLVACCYVYVGNDGKYWLHPDFGGSWDGLSARSENIGAPQLMKSMGAYVSPVDGKHISTRAEHRDHLKRHRLVEVGNEKIGNMTQPEPVRSTREIGQRIKHHLDAVKAMPQKKYNEQVQAAKVNANGI